MSAKILQNLQFGVLEIGSFVGVFLFGVVFLQTFNYYNMYPDDGWVNKTLVATVLICETAQTMGINYQIYRTTIIYYGKIEMLGTSTAVVTVTIFGGIITLLVQTFFALRLIKFLPQPYNKIGVVCIALSTVRFVGAVYLTAIIVVSQTLAEYLHRVSWLISATFTINAAVDVIIASSTLYYLARQRLGGDQMLRISKCLDRLITCTVASGLLTSISTTALVICFNTMKNNLVWLAVYTCVGKLYSNGLLSALNIRKTLRECVQLNPPIPDQFALSRTLRDSSSSRPVPSVLVQ